MALTKKRRKWLEEYLQCWNATEAARRADYSCPNTQGPRLLLDVGIKNEIQHRLDELKMSADQVLIKLKEVAEADVSDIIDIDDDGRPILNLKKAKELGKMHLIKSITPTSNGLKVELHDSLKALELIGKHHALFTDNVNQDGEITFRIVRE